MAAALQAIRHLWQQAGLDASSLGRLRLTGNEPALPSSFAIGTAAQASMAACALAATELAALRGGRAAGVALNMRHAAIECLTFFAIDGRVPGAWDTYSGMYRTVDGWVRLHTNFAHHRDGAMALLGLQSHENTSRADVEQALASWRALDYENAAADKGLVAAALRGRSEWLAHPQAAAVQGQPLITAEEIIFSSIAAAADGGGPARGGFAAGIATASLPNRPLAGLRVLDLTRILAGPVCGRVLAAYGADVMLVNSPHLPNIEAIADTSRAKRSVHVDLRTEQGRCALRELIKGADIVVQGYRPGALEALGFGAEEAARLRPGIIYVSLSAYGHTGPWAGRRGFDSLVQTATGLNHDESAAMGIDLALNAPRALPVQVLDHATGYLMAFAALSAVIRQKHEGGSWHMRLSLARTGEWLRSLGRVKGGFAAPLLPSGPALEAALSPYLYTAASGFGQLTAVRHSVSLDGLACDPVLPSMPPGSHEPRW